MGWEVMGGDRWDSEVLPVRGLGLLLLLKKCLEKKLRNA